MSKKLKIALWIVAGIGLILLIVWGVKRYNAALEAQSLQKKVDDQLDKIKQQFADDAAFASFMKNYVTPYKNSGVMIDPAASTNLGSGDSAKFALAITKVFAIDQTASGTLMKRQVLPPRTRPGSTYTYDPKDMAKVKDRTSVIGKDVFDKIPGGSPIPFEDFLTLIQ